MITRRTSRIVGVALGATALAAATALAGVAATADPAPPATAEAAGAVAQPAHASHGADPDRTLGPIMRIVSPLADATVQPGRGKVRAGSPEGAGFALNLEVVTRDSVPVTVRESTNIRHADLLGHPNPDFPGLRVETDVDLVTPAGGTIRRGTNLASLFNVAGTDDTPGPGVTVWAGWHVLESIPLGVRSFGITAQVRDDAGRTSVDKVRVAVDRSGPGSGQALTPPPGPGATGSGPAHPGGPEVNLLAPRLPTSVATGPSGTPVPPAGSLFFVQVDAVDRARAGIAVSENGPGAGAGLGTILDAGQIAARGPNRFYPGLRLTFDVPLRQPNGNLVPAGANLAPLFNVAGSERQRDGAIRTTADWVVGGSLELPAGKHSVVVEASVTDSTGRVGTDRVAVGVSPTRNGQDLTATPRAAAPSGVARPDRPERLRSRLDGRQEIGPDGSTGAGDLDGRANVQLRLDPRTGQVCYRLSLQRTDPPTRFHVHRGAAGVNGPIVVTFFETGQPPATRGCVTADAETVRSILLAPEQHYANVHTAALPAGAVRGQLVAVG